MGVIGRVGGQSREQFVDVCLFVLGQGRVRRTFAADSGLVAAGGCGGAETAEAVRGVHLRLRRQFLGEAAHGVVLRVGEFVGVLLADEIGPSGRAEEHRTAGEHSDGSVVGIAQHIADVMMRVAGSVHDLESECSGVDDVAVDHRAPLVAEIVAGRNDVFGVHCPGQFETAGDVVVVDVRFEHVGDAYSAFGRQLQYSVDVALRVHHGTDVARADQVAAIAEAGGFDDRHVHRGLLRSGYVRDEYPYPYG